MNKELLEKRLNGLKDALQKAEMEIQRLQKELEQARINYHQAVGHLREISIIQNMMKPPEKEKDNGKADSQDESQDTQ